jgi:hypothetical protein
MSGFGYLVPIDSEIRQRARELLYPGETPSYLGKEAEVAGAFGEAAFERAWSRLGGLDLEHVGGYEFDYRHREIGRIEIKTKPRTVRPEAEYQAGVAVANLEFQHPEAFVFVSLYPKAEAPFFRYEEAWIVGWLSDQEFRERSVLVPKGSTMGGGGTSFRDMRDVNLSQLRPIEDLVRHALGVTESLHAVTNPLRVTEEIRDER